MKGDEIQGKFQTIHSYFSEGSKLFKETIMTSWPLDLIMDLFIFHNNNERQLNKPA